MSTQVLLLSGAVLLVACAVALVPRQRHRVAYVTVIVLVVVGAAIPALASFTGNPSAHSHPAPVLPLNAATMPATTLASPVHVHGQHEPARRLVRVELDVLVGQWVSDAARHEWWCLRRLWL